MTTTLLQTGENARHTYHSRYLSVETSQTSFVKHSSQTSLNRALTSVEDVSPSELVVRQAELGSLSGASSASSSICSIEQQQQNMRLEFS